MIEVHADIVMECKGIYIYALIIGGGGGGLGTCHTHTHPRENLSF